MRIFVLSLVALFMVGCFGTSTSSIRDKDGSMTEISRVSVSPWRADSVRASQNLEQQAKMGKLRDNLQEDLSEDRIVAEQRRITPWPPRNYWYQGGVPSAVCNGHVTDRAECARVRDLQDTWQSYPMYPYGGGFFPPQYGPNYMGPAPRPF